MTDHITSIIYNMPNYSQFIYDISDSAISFPLFIVYIKCLSGLVARKIRAHPELDSAMFSECPESGIEIGATSYDFCIAPYKFIEFLLEPNKLPLSTSGKSRSIESYYNILLT